MKKSQIEVGAVMSGFHVDSVTNLPDDMGRMWRMTYEKNGAELVWLEREDEVKTFAIAFKTLPEDDTGVAHILEHSVLAGSEKYPVKSPFDELRKSSLNVFLNAMTGPDNTAYPFCTRNDQDFLNIADVYLDAVFHPNVVRDPMAFLQEGWHYDIDEKTGALSYNGVVYNEMKGVFANPESRARREAFHYLYPDIVYGRESGGKPDTIPKLTHEKFCAFYHKFYHPSNARIFLDGSVDLTSVLAKLDSYLSAFDRAEKIAPIPFQPPVQSCATLSYPSSDCVKKTILADAWCVGTFRDVDQIWAQTILVMYLTVSNESPLKKALLTNGLCEDVSLAILPGQQRTLIMVVRNTTDEQAGLCRATVRQTIEKLLKDGLDNRRLMSIIDNLEFKLRFESNYFDPQGLVNFQTALSSWLYDGDPATFFDLTGIFKRLRAGISTGLFEKVLRAMFLENVHHVELTYTPSTTLGEEIARRQKEELARRRKAMTEQERADLREQCAAFREYQQRVDTTAAKASIPALHVKDVPPHGHVVEHTISAKGTTTLIKTKSVSAGVVVASVCFPIDGLGRDELVKVPLLTDLLGELPTSEHDSLSLQTECLSKSGFISFVGISRQQGTYLMANIAMLEANAVETIRLLKEIITKTRFDDLATIAKKLNEKRLSKEDSVKTHGNTLAKIYAARRFARRWTARDILLGYEQLRWLQHVQVNKPFAQSIAALAKKIFVNDGLVISVTDNISAEAEEMLCTIVPHGDGTMRVASQLDCEEIDFTGMRIDGDTGFSGVSVVLPPNVNYTGAMRVAAKMLSLEYLHKEIREVGGAYGTNLSMHPSGLIVSDTYRDPTPMTSAETIRKSGEWLRKYAKSAPTLDRYILATIADLDAYQGPLLEASSALELFLAGKSIEDEERERQEILSTKASDLEATADVLETVMPQACSFVVGGATQLARLPPSKVTSL